MLLGFENHKAWDLEARLTQRLDQPLTGTGLSFSQYGLDLRESLLDRVQIRRVGRYRSPHPASSTSSRTRSPYGHPDCQSLRPALLGG